MEYASSDLSERSERSRFDVKLQGKCSEARALINTVNLTRGDQRMKFDPIGNGGDGEKGLSGLLLTVRLKGEG